MRSFPYQLFDIQYRRGKEIPLADTLSRVTPTPVEEDGIQLPIVAVNLITSNIPVSSTEIELICEETSKDPTLTLLRHYIHMGWPIKMENYGNTAVKVLGMFHAFLRWKDKVYKQLFYITDCDRSPNLLSRDACYILGVLKPCYTVENYSSPTVNASNKGDVLANSFLHQKMKESQKKLSNCSNKWSINQSQLQGDQLTKQDILDIYSDVFTRIGKFPGMPYKFQLKQNAKPATHAPRKVPIHLQDAFHKEIRNLEKLGIL